MMRALTGQEVRQAVRGRWLSRKDLLPIRGISIDSRTAQRDDLFIAIKGDSFDAHEYLEAAAEKGCVAAMVNFSHPISPELLERFPVGVIGVEDTRAALLDLGGFYRSVLPATVVGVTGSNGKTTVKEMVHHVLSKRLTGTASPKSYNNEIGVPLTLLNASAGDDYIIAEVGTNSPGEITRLARAIRPNIGVITNVSEAHLERLENVQRIAVEKASLLGWLGERDVAVVSADSEQLNHALKSYHRRMIRFGEASDAQLRLTGYETDGQNSRFQINDRDWVDLPLPGRHNALNAMATIAVCARFGFTQEDAAAALADFSGVDMRLQKMQLGEIQVINDSYNANPASMLAAVSVLSDTPASRRVFVAGDMRELGEQSEQIHTQLGLSIAARRVDVVVGVGELGKHIAEGAARRDKQTAVFDTVDDAKAGLGKLLQPGDLVVLKGSRAMGMEAIVPALEETFGPAKPVTMEAR